MRINLEYGGQSVEITTDYETIYEQELLREKLILALRAINDEGLANYLEKYPNTNNMK